MGTGVEPGIATPHHGDRQLTTSKVVVAHIGYFQLTTGRGLQALGDLHHAVVVEIKARHRIIALGIQWFFFQ
ncbi:hypothetical protein D3C78_1537510 [compost metagenome]